MGRPISRLWVPLSLLMGRPISRLWAGLSLWLLRVVPGLILSMRLLGVMLLRRSRRLARCARRVPVRRVTSTLLAHGVGSIDGGAGAVKALGHCCAVMSG